VDADHDIAHVMCLAAFCIEFSHDLLRLSADEIARRL
jgi:hypothetical protein